MKLDEFKQWFEGFAQAIDKAPNETQWALIRTKIRELNYKEEIRSLKNIPLDVNLKHYIGMVCQYCGKHTSQCYYGGNRHL